MSWVRSSWTLKSPGELGRYRQPADGQHNNRVAEKEDIQKVEAPFQANLEFPDYRHREKSPVMALEITCGRQTCTTTVPPLSTPSRILRSIILRDSKTKERQ